MFRLTSLKQKIAVLIILPLCLVMLIAGAVGMRLIGGFLLSQWEETAMSKMERSAHEVDMRLMRPKRILGFFLQNRASQGLQADRDILIQQLKAIDGVVEVVSESFNSQGKNRMHRMGRLQNTSVSPLSYNSKLDSQTVSIVAQFGQSTSTRKSYIEVVISFSDLINQIVKAPWWQGNKAFILDQEGKILASTDRGNLPLNYPVAKKKQFQSFGFVEEKIWKAIENNPSGTVLSSGMPPDTVSGFYRLTEAPWTLVVMSSGTSVLQPILTFRTYYLVICGAGILCVALFLWFITGKSTRTINLISSAANKLAKGTFSAPIASSSKDEIGDLTRSFNIMSSQLKERLQLKQDMSLAGEIQANLLPPKDLIVPGLEVALLTKYCDETGGDYVDILTDSQQNQQVSVVVGDVVGHGIGAALLMTTLRALLKCRANITSPLNEVIKDVNKHLCKDTQRFGNFATLFYLTVDVARKTLTWVRCGHDPAIIFCPNTGTFSELKGKGIALGVNEDFQYSHSQVGYIESDQIILLGTDGIWEIENDKGESFGKTRTKSSIAKYANLPAREIADQLLKEIEQFSNSHQSDDITFAIIKTSEHV